MTPLLGFTWLFGLLSSEDKICAYIQTVLSSTQVNTTISIFHQVGVEKCYPSKGKAQKNIFKISTAITAHVYKFCFTGIPGVLFHCVRNTQVTDNLGVNGFIIIIIIIIITSIIIIYYTHHCHIYFTNASLSWLKLSLSELRKDDWQRIFYRDKMMKTKKVHKLR